MSLQDLHSTSPAPSLQELPPERGTMLELHSIGDDRFDGRIVEFIAMDEETGKYQVTSFDEQKQNMTVKPSTCKRPDIKLLKLRRILMKLAWDGRRQRKPLAHNIAALTSLLKKDPCCAPAYFKMAEFYKKEQNDLNQDGPRKQYDDEIVSCVFRGVANEYAYQSFLEESNLHVEGKRNLLATVLVKQIFLSGLSLFEEALEVDYDPARYADLKESPEGSRTAEFHTMEARRKQKRHTMSESAELILDYLTTITNDYRAIDGISSEQAVDMFCNIIRFRVDETAAFIEKQKDVQGTEEPIPTKDIDGNITHIVEMICEISKSCTPLQPGAQIRFMYQGDRSAFLKVTEVFGADFEGSHGSLAKELFNTANSIHFDSREYAELKIPKTRKSKSSLEKAKKRLSKVKKLRKEKYVALMKCTEECFEELEKSARYYDKMERLLGPLAEKVSRIFVDMVLSIISTFTEENEHLIQQARKAGRQPELSPEIMSNWERCMALGGHLATSTGGKFLEDVEDQNVMLKFHEQQEQVASTNPQREISYDIPECDIYPRFRRS